jgi:carbamate kinase
MRYVIAVGGNALEGTVVPAAFSRAVLGLYGKGNGIVITHGNGPQVGELAALEHKSLAVLTAQTQAELGLEIENSLGDAARGLGSLKVATILTRALVSARDREFRNPTKPIGAFVGHRQATKLAREGFKMRLLIHGYRRVVPSPMPEKILESGLIRDLLERRYLVVAAGGGGIAVVKRGRRLAYAEAVIDKDRASSLLAEALGADRFVVLTNVDGAYLHFGTKGQRLIGSATAKEMREHLEAGEFEKGSMLPKVEACVRFVMRTGKPAAIGNLRYAKEIFSLKKATVIWP